MAIKATIYKAHLQIADMDRNVYGEHALTLPLQPSETEERLMTGGVQLKRKNYLFFIIYSVISSDTKG